MGCRISCLSFEYDGKQPSARHTVNEVLDCAADLGPDTRGSLESRMWAYCLSWLLQALTHMAESPSLLTLPFSRLPLCSSVSWMLWGCPPTAPLCMWNLGGGIRETLWSLLVWMMAFSWALWAGVSSPWNGTEWTICTRLPLLTWALVAQAGWWACREECAALALAIPISGAARRREPLGQSVHYF